MENTFLVSCAVAACLSSTDFLFCLLAGCHDNVLSEKTQTLEHNVQSSKIVVMPNAWKAKKKRKEKKKKRIQIPSQHS